MTAVTIAVASMSCIRYAAYRQMTARTGTCEGACQHYIECKDENVPGALQGCIADCRDIYVYDGEADQDSLMTFEGLDCPATIAFVDGKDGGREHAATSDPAAKRRSRAH